MSDLTNRLLCKYPIGPIMANGEPEFGYRDMPGPIESGASLPSPIMLEAAQRIADLEAENAKLRADSDRLDQLERALITGSHLTRHKRKFSLKEFTNYEFEVFAGVREAIDHYAKSKDLKND